MAARAITSAIAGAMRLAAALAAAAVLRLAEPIAALNARVDVKAVPEHAEANAAAIVTPRVKALAQRAVQAVALLPVVKELVDRIAQIHAQPAVQELVVQHVQVIVKQLVWVLVATIVPADASHLAADLALRIVPVLAVQLAPVVAAAARQDVWDAAADVSQLVKTVAIPLAPLDAETTARTPVRQAATVCAWRVRRHRRNGMARIETYSDQMARLFPPGGTEEGKFLAPRTVTWQVTDGCNLCCTYCYQINKSQHVMNWEVAKAFCDMLLSATPENNSYINPEISSGLIMEFIGGEPFLAIDLIDQICDYMITRMIELQHPWATRFMISICSNGVLYFDPRVQRFMEKHKGHLSFSITVDGCKELHDACRVFPDGSGSYDLAIAGVHHFRDHFNGEMGSKMTLAPGNIHYTFKAVENLLSEGYTDINLNCVYEEGWTVEHARILYSELVKTADHILENDLFETVELSIFEERFFRPKAEDDVQNWCGGLGLMLSCDWKGDLYPCIRYMESSLGDERPPIIIGNVFRGIVQTEGEKQLVTCMACVDRRTQSTDECFYCPIAEGCSWCSAYNYQDTGSYDKRATYICVMHKARALANAYYYNMAYLHYGLPKAMQLHIPKEWAEEIIGEAEWEKLKMIEQMAMDPSRLGKETEEDHGIRKNHSV